jgi:hypothetical protein
MGRVLRSVLVPMAVITLVSVVAIVALSFMLPSIVQGRAVVAVGVLVGIAARPEQAWHRWSSW